MLQRINEWDIYKIVQTDLSSLVVSLLVGDSGNSRISFESLVLRKDTDCAEGPIVGWSRRPRLLDCGLLLFFCKTDTGLSILVHRLNVVVVGAWAWWEQVRVWHGELSSYISADPVCDVWLVHWNLIDFVLAGARHVKILRPRVGLHAEEELGLLARLIIRVRRVSKVEVSQDVVSVGGRYVFSAT